MWTMSSSECTRVSPIAAGQQDVTNNDLDEDFLGRKQPIASLITLTHKWAGYDVWFLDNRLLLPVGSCIPRFSSVTDSFHIVIAWVNAQLSGWIPSVDLLDFFLSF